MVVCGYQNIENDKVSPVAMIQLSDNFNWMTENLHCHIATYFEEETLDSQDMYQTQMHAGAAYL